MGLQFWRDGTALLKAEPRVCVWSGLLFYSDLELKPPLERWWALLLWKLDREAIVLLV